MKRLILPAALVAALAAASCAPAPAPVNNTNQTANTNVATPTPASTTGSAADITEKEKELWEALKGKDSAAFEAALSPDQIYVTGEGVYDRAATLDSIKKLKVEEYSLDDIKVVNVAADVAVITYTSDTKGAFDGKPLPAAKLRESSAWVNRGGKWLTAYHQDTEIMSPTPSPSPGGATPAATATATTTPAASPSPSASPATAADVENQIWDALRRKDWDGFASHLAADAVEVEPDGVYDKAGSVAGVKQFDFTGVTLTELKEVKLSPNATLVTYTVKGPRPPFSGKGMRHTTIMANRGGRWLAVFHQGTQVK